MATKNLATMKKTKDAIQHYIKLGYTDNIELTRVIMKMRFGMTHGEVSRLVNKYTEEALLGVRS
ncbi:MAG TPA: hypothetical protein DCM40_08480 [Maribacter sp.]|nr:hypothetical protein [Maribacter sp.]